MILVDTSVLIDYFKNFDTPVVRTFDSILDMGLSYGINDYIYQELLQGTRNVAEFHKLKEYLDTLQFYALQFGRESFERAAYLNVLCRKSGVTIRSTIDLLVAETAIENNIYLLHNDYDFLNMSRVIPELKVYKVESNE